MLEEVHNLCWKRKAKTSLQVFVEVEKLAKGKKYILVDGVG